MVDNSKPALTGLRRTALRPYLSSLIRTFVFVKQLVMILGTVISYGGCCPSLLNYYYLIEGGFAKIPGQSEKRTPRIQIKLNNYALITSDQNRNVSCNHKNLPMRGGNS